MLYRPVAVHYRKLIVIGAPRSGTNMLRDALCRLPAFGTWPCDEINYIWRHGNARHASDEFPESFATPKISAYINCEFDRCAAKLGCGTLVEKTCANSLRLDFVRKVVPDAKYIYIVRNGVDAAASAAKRWRARPDLRYLAAKARFVPASDLPYYAARYTANRFSSLVLRQVTSRMWGPRIGTDEPDSHCSALELSALQWKRCNEKAIKSFSTMDENTFLKVKYEELVCNPLEGLCRILGFLGEDDSCVDERTLAGIRRDSIGRGYQELSGSDIQKVHSVLGDSMSALGYA